MHRCDVCGAVSKPRESRLRHNLLRADGSIARELTVCPACQRRIIATGRVEQPAPAVKVEPPSSDQPALVAGDAM